MSRITFSSRRGTRFLSGLVLAAAAVVALHALDVRQIDTVQPALAAPPDGQQLYMTRCMSCHQVNGQGIMGVFPPLDGADWVTGDKGRLARIVLHGMTGEMKVKDQVYSGAMPPWGPVLKDDEIAAILTYVRSSWSNDADAVTADEVAKIRTASSARKQPWTEKELADAANQGIPE